MKWLQLLVVFVLGAAAGLAGGGYLGYHIGASDNSVDTAPKASVIPVQEEVRPPAVTPTPPPAEETTAAPAEMPANTPVTPTAVTPAETVADTPITAPATPAVAPEQPAAAAGKVEEFIISPNDYSELMWVGYKTVVGQRISMEGGFANFNGKITAENEDPNKSFVEVIVDTKSIFSESTILTTVLKTDIFFNVAQHPEARFASTKIEPAENGYLVTGNFTMKGVTQGVQFPAVIERRPEGVFVKAEFTIDRKLWDVGYDQYEDSVVLKEVVISFEILAEPVQ